jgi:hypothetical protein
VQERAGVQVQETGQEGPVRAGQVIVRLGCAVRGCVWPDGCKRDVWSGLSVCV